MSGILTVAEVRRLAWRVRELASDEEAAHVAEDQLHVELLQAIASSTCEDPVACAAAALQTQKLHFARRCA